MHNSNNNAGLRGSSNQVTTQKLVNINNYVAAVLHVLLEGMVVVKLKNIAFLCIDLKCGVDKKDHNFFVGKFSF